MVLRYSLVIGQFEIWIDSERWALFQDQFAGPRNIKVVMGVANLQSFLPSIIHINKCWQAFRSEVLGMETLITHPYIIPILLRQLPTAPLLVRPLAQLPTQSWVGGFGADLVALAVEHVGLVLAHIYSWYSLSMMIRLIMVGPQSKR